MPVLPPDLKEHSSSIAAALFSALVLIGGAFATLWRTREKEKENAIATALHGVREEIVSFGDKFDATILRIFDKIDVMEHENRQRDIRCAALHGKGPTGWDGQERRKVPR
jgi:hypothetical protein